MRTKIFLLFLVSLFINNQLFAQIIEVDFDQGMGSKQVAAFNTISHKGQKSIDYFNVYKSIYENNLPSTKEYCEIPKIPKVINYIWVGDKPLPKYYKKHMDSCKKIHPDWEIKVWRNEDIEKLVKDKSFAQPDLEELMDICMINKMYSCHKDLIGYLMVYNFGGVVLDLDYECIQPLDELHHKYNLYATLEPPGLNYKVPIITTSLIAGSKGNKMFLDSYKRAGIKMHKRIKDINTFIKRLGRKIRNFFSTEQQAIIKGVSTKEFQGPYGEIIYETCSKRKCDDMIVFPATYFNPDFRNSARALYSIKDKIRIKLGLIEDEEYFIRTYPETIASQDWHEPNVIE